MMCAVRNRVRKHFGVGKRAPWTPEMEEVGRVAMSDARRVGLPNIVLPPRAPNVHCGADGSA